MFCNDTTLESIREKMAENDAIVREVKADPALLEEVKYRILKRELHNQLMDLVADAINNNIVQINSVDDLCTLLALDLRLNGVKL